MEEDHSIKQEDLEQIAVVYDEIREVWRGLDKEHDKILAEDFDESIKTTMGELSDVAKSRCPSAILNVHMLKAKYALHRLCFNKLSQLSQLKSPELKDLFSKIIPSLDQIQQTTLNLLLSSIESTLSLNQQILSFSVAPQANPEYEQALQEKSETIIQLTEEKERMLEEISNLQEENKKYLETIIKRTKTSADQVLQRPIPTVSLISKQELKELISLIYASKTKYDQNQPEGSPRQTLEQHMYLFLAEKLRSRSKSIQKVAEIIAGIRKNSDDVDVLLFAKILRSDCDENYKFLHDQVRDTIAEMIKEHSNNEEIKQKSWTEIVQFVYDEKDSKEMLSYIATQKKGKSVMPTSEFLNFLLRFQLKSHEKYISKFNSLFKIVDSDSDGIITEEEFVELCQRLELQISNQEISRFLQVIDPYGTQQITYSDCVAIFSTEMVVGKSNPILQELT